MPRRKTIPVSGQLYGGRLNRTPAPDPSPVKPRKEPGMAMSVEDMADQLAIGRNVAYQLVQQPDFPSFMIGRRVLVSKKGLQEWIDEQCKKGSENSLSLEPSDP